MQKFYKSAYKYNLIGLLIFILPSIGLSQCDANLISNGSFTGEPDNSSVPDGWETDSYPDLNDASGLLYTSSTNYSWIGTVLTSNDGGTWQNIFGPETVYQYVELNVGSIYELCLEYVAQGIIWPPNLIFDQPVGVQFIVNDEVLYISDPDTSQYTWETECISFTTSQEINKIEFQASEDQYLGIDQACLTPKISSFISHVNENIGYSIYPNILNGHNQFRIKTLNEKSVSLDIFSGNGTRVYHAGHLQHEDQITLENNLPKGVYYVQFNLNKINSYGVQFIIQ